MSMPEREDPAEDKKIPTMSMYVCTCPCALIRSGAHARLLVAVPVFACWSLLKLCILCLLAACKLCVQIRVG